MRGFSETRQTLQRPFPFVKSRTQATKKPWTEHQAREDAWPVLESKESTHGVAPSQNLKKKHYKTSATQSLEESPVNVRIREKILVEEESFRIFTILFVQSRIAVTNLLQPLKKLWILGIQSFSSISSKHLTNDCELVSMQNNGSDVSKT